jgi:hypothetical protein
VNGVFEHAGDSNETAASGSDPTAWFDSRQGHSFQSFADRAARKWESSGMTSRLHRLEPSRSLRRRRFAPAGGATVGPSLLAGVPAA